MKKLGRWTNKVRFASISLHEDEEKVVGHKAFSLAEYADLVRQGKPISVPNATNVYYDGDMNPITQMPLSETRGVDLNDMWNDSQARGKKLSKLQMSLVDNAKNV